MTITGRDRKLKPCTCSDFYATTKAGEIARTGCTGQTNNYFLQGHDAKLVSFLVTADLNNWEIRRGESKVVYASAAAAAGTVSLALAAKADKAIVAKLDRQARARTPKVKTEAAAPRKVAVKFADTDRDHAGELADAVIATPPITTPALVVPTPVPTGYAIRAKVGRWEYEGHVDADGAVFTYTSKLGMVKSTTDWTKVA